MTRASRHAVERVARGDWQTPPALAQAVLDVALARMRTPPRTVLEPTCGKGAFLIAAQARLPRAQLVGRDIDEAYVAAARAVLGEEADLAVADFFTTSWADVLRGRAEPLLVIGNPPWVTSAALGALGSRVAPNAPPKRNDDGLRGMDARTGRSNFDVSEWMIVRLLEALAGREATIAVLCKAAVARKVLALAARRGLTLSAGGVWSVDARAHWEASVAAVLLVAHTSADAADGAGETWPLHASLDAAAHGALRVQGGRVVPGGAAFDATRALAGICRPEWRSGMKHDCARVMELTQQENGSWANGLGETVVVEEHVLFPLVKGTDIARAARPSAHAASAPRAPRAVVVPQRALGQDTTALAHTAPLAFAYLSRHAAALDARRSSIYRGQPPFAVFGTGPYAFAPWKVAVSGLHKHASFALLGPRDGKPVMLDDTSYFLPFDDEVAARAACAALGSPLAQSFLEARVFWEDKRPLTKALLQSLDLDALVRALAGLSSPSA